LAERLFSPGKLTLQLACLSQWLLLLLQGLEELLDATIAIAGLVGCECMLSPSHAWIVSVVLSSCSFSWAGW
jgi:hypothetical protein